jgi:hypothetical protein
MMIGQPFPPSAFPINAIFARLTHTNVTDQGGAAYCLLAAQRLQIFMAKLVESHQ